MVEVCEPDDAAAFARFKAAQGSVGAVLESHDQGGPLGKSWYFAVGDDRLWVLVDNWLVRIDGPDDLVGKVLALSIP